MPHMYLLPYIYISIYIFSFTYLPHSSMSMSQLDHYRKIWSRELKDKRRTLSLVLGFFFPSHCIWNIFFFLFSSFYPLPGCCELDNKKEK